MRKIVFAALWAIFLAGAAHAQTYMSGKSAATSLNATDTTWWCQTAGVGGASGCDNTKTLNSVELSVLNTYFNAHLPTPIGIANGGTNATSASGTALDNITGFSSNGLLERTGAGAYSFDAVPLVVGKGGTGATSFTANMPLFGNGTSAIAVGTRSGNTTEVATISGSLVTAHCIQADASGNLVDSGGACSGGTTTITLGAGLAKTSTTYNPGTDTVTNGNTINTQLFYNSVASSCTVNSNCVASSTNDSGRLLIPTAASVTFTVPAPGGAGSGGFLFGYDGTHSYSLSTTGNVYGTCGSGTTSVTGITYDVQLVPDGTNWKCLASGAPSGSGLSGMTSGQVPIAATASTVTSSKALTNASGTKIQTSSGTLTNGDCAQFNASGDVVDAGGACGTGSGNTTSTSLTTNKLPKANGVNSIIDSSVSDNGTSVTTTEPTVFNNTVSVANEGTTGTTVNLLAKLTGAPSTAIKITTSDMSGISGVVVSGAGTTGSALITRSGQASCVFDGATTAGDYVQASTGTAGDCHDAGAAYPTNGQVLGRVLSTNGAGGTYSMNVIGSEVNASNPVATASGGNVTLTGPQEVYFCTGACTITLPALVAGQEYCVANNAGVSTAITFAALGGSAAYEKPDWSGYGTAGTGTLSTSGGTPAVGDAACLHVLDTTHVQVMSVHGSAWAAS